MLAENIQFDDVDEMTLMFEHFDDLKAELGYSTVWSMSDTALPLDFKIFSDKQRIVTYKCIKNMSNSGHAVEWQTFTSIALGDWHIYIEDFEVQDDGTLELVTGS